MLLQLKLDEVNSEMTALLQAVPQWEGNKDISSTVKSYILDMTKRVTGDIDSEFVSYGSYATSPSGLDRPASADAASRRVISEKDLSLSGDRGATKDRGSSWRPRSQPEDTQGVASIRDFLSSPTKADSRVSASIFGHPFNLDSLSTCCFSPLNFSQHFPNPLVVWVVPDTNGSAYTCVQDYMMLMFWYLCIVQGGNCISPGRTSRGTRNIINQHLRTIRVLEERLAAKESSVKAKDEALKEATEDLVRDERIFAEKVEAHLSILFLQPIWSFSYA